MCITTENHIYCIDTYSHVFHLKLDNWIHNVCENQRYFINPLLLTGKSRVKNKTLEMVETTNDIAFNVKMIKAQ